MAESAAAETEQSDAEGLALDIGQRLRTLRTAAGLSGRQLAAAAGVSQPFLSQLESGQSSLSLSTLYRLAAALHVDPADLLPPTPSSDVELIRAPDRPIPVSDHLRAASARAILRGGKRITEFYDYVIEPGEYVEEWFQSRAEHVLYVIDGQIRVEFGSRPDVVVAQGEALFYSAHLPHRWHLDSDQAARVVLVAVSP